MKDAWEIMLTERERTLILKYGYPFDGIRGQLKDAAGKQGQVAIVDTPYWWERVVGNLSLSMNEDVDDPGLLEELDELCHAIEWRLRQGGSESS